MNSSFLSFYYFSSNKSPNRSSWAYLNFFTHTISFAWKKDTIMIPRDELVPSMSTFRIKLKKKIGSLRLIHMKMNDSILYYLTNLRWNLANSLLLLIFMVNILIKQSIRNVIIISQLIWFATKRRFDSEEEKKWKIRRIGGDLQNVHHIFELVYKVELNRIFDKEQYSVCNLFEMLRCDGNICVWMVNTILVSTMLGSRFINNVQFYVRNLFRNNGAEKTITTTKKQEKQQE